MSKHTEGPWFAEMSRHDERWKVWHEGGAACVAVCPIGTLPDPTGEANARLIAAAPESYAFVQMVQAIGAEAAASGEIAVWKDSFARVMAAADEVIDKVEGGAS